MCNSLFIGPASAPMILNAQSASSSVLLVAITTPTYGSVCVDEYKVNISSESTEISSLSLNQKLVVSNSSQLLYNFNFTTEITLDMLISINASITSVAITNGMEGDIATEALIDVLNREITTSDSLMFSTTGIIIIIIY